MSWRAGGPQQSWFVDFAFTDEAVLAGGDDCIGIYRSPNGEPPWEKVAADFCAWALAVGDGVVLAGDPYGRGVRRSQDGGDSWSLVVDGFPGNGDRYASVWGLAVSPFGGRVYAAVGSHNPHGGSAQGAGLWRMSGGAWEVAGLEGRDLSCVWLSPVDEDVIVVGLGGRMAQGEGGLLRSADGGASFQPAGFEGQGVVNVCGSPDRLYAAVVGTGAVISEDAGQSWRPVRDGSATALTWGIRQDPSRPERLYQIVLASEQSACWRSDDGGESWAPTALSGVIAIGLGVGPDGAAYVGTYDMGFWRSDDGGGSWRSVESGISHSYVYSNITACGSDLLVPVHMGGGGPAGVYRSEDGGSSWLPTEGPRPQVVANTYQVVVDPGDPSRCWAACFDPQQPGNGVWGSTDGGRTWSVVGVESAACVSMFIDPRVPAVIWAGGTEGLWRSGDGGASWSAAGLDGLYVTSLAAAPWSADVLLAATGGTGWGANRPTGFWASEDGGSSWSALPVCAERGGYNAAFGLDPSERSVYLAAEGGLWLTRDGGQTATLLVDRPQDRATCVVVDPTDAALYYAGSSYVALDGGAVLRSGDGGVGWEDWTDGLPSREVWWLTLDPGRRLYASTFGSGLATRDL
jgi:photosystem II stability/assembly factor-like uncharacterized protein